MAHNALQTILGAVGVALLLTVAIIYMSRRP